MMENPKHQSGFWFLGAEQWGDGDHGHKGSRHTTCGEIQSMPQYVMVSYLSTRINLELRPPPKTKHV